MKGWSSLKEQGEQQAKDAELANLRERLEMAERMLPCGHHRSCLQIGHEGREYCEFCDYKSTANARYKRLEKAETDARRMLMALRVARDFILNRHAVGGGWWKEAQESVEAIDAALAAQEPR